MSCNAFSIHQDPATGTVTIVTEDGVTTIRPGSQVTVAQTGTDTIITVDGSSYTIPHGLPAGEEVHTTAVYDPVAGTLTITEPGGSPVIVPIVLSEGMSYSWDDDARILTLTHESSSVNISIPEMPDVPVITLTDTSITVDGHTVSFPVTTASISGGNVTINNPGGGSITFPTGGGGGGGGGGDTVEVLNNENGTYRVEVNGSDSIEFWGVRPTEIEAQGDGVYHYTQYDHTGSGSTANFNTGTQEVRAEVDGITYTAVNADGSEVSWVSIVPEGMLFLQDPVIYLRQSGGTATPPIADQDDLTEANAFDSFSAIWTFLTTCIVQGTITIDARGSFNSTNFNLVDAANATLLTVRGDPTDESLLTFNWSRTALATYQDGVRAQGGIRMRLGYCTLHASATTSNSRAILASDNSTLELFGVVKFTHSGNVAHPGSTCRLLYTGNNGKIQSVGSTVLGEPSLTIEVDFAEGTDLQSFALSQENSLIELSDVRVTLAADIDLGSGVFVINSQSRVIISKAQADNFEPEFVGAGQFVGPAFNIQALSGLRLQRITGLDWPHTNVADWLNVDGAGYTLDRTSYVRLNETFRFGTTGTDYT